MPERSKDAATEKLDGRKLAALRTEKATGAGFELHVYHRDSRIEVELPRDRPVVIGRGADADIPIDEASLSKQHARFELSGARVRVVDLGSTNGTWDGERRVEEAFLAAGERVTLGSVVVVAQARPGREQGVRRVTGHDAFRVLVDDEIARARQFGRGFTLLLLRCAAPRPTPAHAYASAVSEELEPADKMALFSPDTLEVLLPEVGAAQVTERVTALLQAAEAQRVSLRVGAATYPVAGTNIEALFDAARAAQRSATEREPFRQAILAALPATAPPRPSASELVFRSPAIKSFLEDVEKVARMKHSVILFGETGAGKEVMARRLHDASPRKKKPFLALNCGALPPDLVEATLFGHERGAFTSATARRDGYFQAADGGTLLLDEIGELPLAAQVALLRVLEGKRVTRVGDTAESPVDVRVIAATHRDLEAMCARGEFRSDLYYRLSSITLTIPPLRERPEDVVALAERFLQEAAAESASDLGASDSAPRVTGIDPEVLALFRRYSWPGNVRELRNVVVRGVALARSTTLAARDLPDRIQKLSPRSPDSAPPPAGSGLPGSPASEPGAALAPGDPGVGTYKDRLFAFERAMLLDALRRTGGNQTAAARLLDVSTRTIVRKITELGIRKADTLKGEA
jgi:DNA-binding NtrC family response regulator